MTDHDALLAAICADPDEDTPRLAYADFLEENGEGERAAFVRAQVELARTPPWEPFAVLCRWRRPEWVTGRPFRHTLPPVHGSDVEWHPAAFRRGLGWRVNVRSLVAWETFAPGIVRRAPVGEMTLSAATLDQWVEFAGSPVVPMLRRLHFTTSPIEPLRVLRHRPEALGITDLHFERASGAGMPEVIEDLLASPLGRAVRGLHFHMGYESLNDLIDALNFGARSGLERLSLSAMGLTADHVRRLGEGPVLARLGELDLRGNPLGNEGIGALQPALMDGRHGPGLHTLGLSGTGLAAQGVEVLSLLPGVRRLDLSRNPLTPRAARLLSRSWGLAGLRSLDLHTCRAGERELYHLTRARFWPNLVELDLRDNPVPPAGVRHLLAAPVPADLTALVLPGDQIGADARNDLRRRYGERVVFAAAMV